MNAGVSKSDEQFDAMRQKNISEEIPSETGCS